MALHAIGVFDKVQKRSPEKSTSKAQFNSMEIYKWPVLPYSFLPINSCVKMVSLTIIFSGDIQLINILIVTS